ncbi:MAG: RagB/SusD family nutrient uptake outer membrane protein [Prevotellaceae bacterium]|jgi:hypothetical protein|nr:RagB/SusD family nutrient uptake outer membrane protein [Prevotellaceae bacterium]
MKTKIWILFFPVMLLFGGCADFLDRTQLTAWDDENFWTSESNLALYATGFYDHCFIGYNSGWGTTAAPWMGFTFNDDALGTSTLSQFESTVPNDRGSSTATELQWMGNYGGLGWCFVWVRKVNVMIDRIQDKMSDILSPDAYSHWMGIARFFRGIEYAGIVSSFGDVPYFDREIGSAEHDQLYKARTPRNEVMDAIYDDFVFALDNVKGNVSSKREVNTYTVASFITRWALFEGTWQKYHENNTARSQKFLELAVRAGDFVINSGRYSFDTDFRTLFGSQTLAANREVILYRHYDDGYGITHNMASQCNMVEVQSTGPTLSLIKSFICNDGTDWQTSDDPVHKNFELSNLVKTRDSRFEATFYKSVTYRSLPSFMYISKFINREGHNFLDQGLAGPPNQYISSYNTNDYPVMRYAEVVLNWVEAKAELGNCTQADIDKSINAIRNRPIAAEATAKGVQKTAALSIANLPNSPNRGDVSQLLWEIRRERRMEFAFEYSRLQDLRRWKKLEYMDGALNPDILTSGTWVKFSEFSIDKQFPATWATTLGNITGVRDLDGNETLFTGTNTNIEGFFYRLAVVNRRPFLDQFNMNPYLAPVGRNQRLAYETRGYFLAQTKGWPDEF